MARTKPDEQQDERQPQQPSCAEHPGQRYARRSRMSGHLKSRPRRLGAAAVSVVAAIASPPSSGSCSAAISARVSSRVRRRASERDVFLARANLGLQSVT